MIFKGLYSDKWQYAYVVFSNNVMIRPLKILKKNFRHCYVILGDDKNWVIIEATSKNIFVELIGRKKIPNLPAEIKKQGKTVIRTIIKSPKTRKIPFSFFSCVELTKKIIGINNYKIFTPYQLYKYLTKRSDYSSSKRF